MITAVNNSKSLILLDKRSNKYVRDSQVVFHIEADDFFATTATVLGLIRERLEKRYGKGIAFESGTMEEVERELIYLHEHYSIKRKDKTKNGD